MRWYALIVSVSLAVGLVSCGEGQNINSFFVAKGQKEAIDYLRFKSQAAYDKGDYEEALGFAKTAYDFNPSSEDTSVLLGYIHLSLAGIDTFQLARNMINLSKGVSCSAAATPTPTPTPTPTSAAAPSSAASTLSSLSCVIGMDENELSVLVLDGNKTKTATGTEVLGDSTLATFKSLPVKLPKNATDARLSASKTVANIASAITYICPFVNDAAKAAGDIRHSAANCPPSTEIRRNGGKAHFLWSIAHLGEAIAFNSIVLYGPSGTPNIINRATAMSATGASALGISAFLATIVEFSNVMEVILPSTGTDSMLNAMFNDLNATAGGFGQIAGIPDSVTKSIKDSIAALQATVTKGGDAASQAKNNNSALKAQFTATAAKTLDTKITALAAADPAKFAAQKTEICAAYKTIATADAAACK